MKFSTSSSNSNTGALAAANTRPIASVPGGVVIAGQLPSLAGHRRRRQETPAHRSFGDNAEVVHLNRAIRASVGAQPAADAPVLDDDLAIIAAMNAADRTADQARWNEHAAARAADRAKRERYARPDIQSHCLDPLSPSEDFMRRLSFACLLLLGLSAPALADDKKRGD